MKSLFNSLQKALKTATVFNVITLILWYILYTLTDLYTISKYFWTGVVVCVINTWIANIRACKIKNILYVRNLWIMMAGIVLVSYHAGFEIIAVLAAVIFLISPFFKMTLYEGIVGLTLLLTLARLIL